MRYRRSRVRYGLSRRFRGSRRRRGRVGRRRVRSAGKCGFRM